MSFYVYIIKSQTAGIFYKGSSLDPAQRLLAHNNGESSFTANHRPWQLVYVEQCASKTEMLVREKKLKRGNQRYFEQLIQSPKNIAAQSLGTST
jgi:putative endonuclease